MEFFRRTIACCGEVPRPPASSSTIPRSRAETRFQCFRRLAALARYPLTGPTARLEDSLKVLPNSAIAWLVPNKTRRRPARRPKSGQETIWLFRDKRNVSRPLFNRSQFPECTCSKISHHLASRSFVPGEFCRPVLKTTVDQFVAVARAPSTLSKIPAAISLRILRIDQIRPRLPQSRESTTRSTPTHGNLACHRFQRRQTEPFVQRRKNEHVGGRTSSGRSSSGDISEQMDAVFYFLLLDFGVDAGVFPALLADRRPNDAESCPPLSRTP